MGRRKISLRKTWLLVFLLLFIFPIASQLSYKATAATELAPLSERAQTWLVLSAITTKECHLREENNSSYSASEVASGKLFYSKGSDAVAGVGTLIEPDDGTVSCWKEPQIWLTPVLDSWGYAGHYGKFLEDIGYSFKEASGYVLEGDWPGDIVYERIKGLVPVKYLKDGYSSSTDVLYAVYLNTFLNTGDRGCHAAPVSPISEVDTTSDDYLANKNLYYQIKHIDTSTMTVQDWYYKTDKDRSSESKIVGYGVNAPRASGNEATCTEIAAKLNYAGLANAALETIKGGDVTLPDTTAPADGDDTEVPPSCDGSIPGLGWLICKILEGTDSLVSGSVGILKGLLTIEREEYEDPVNTTAEVNGLRRAWGAMRLISTVLLVGIALFVILSQILGSELLSAYSIKKIIPRLVVAVILVQLSWFLSTNFIAIINVIGRGLEELIYAPFGGEATAGDLGAIMNLFHGAAGSGAVAGAEGVGLATAAITFSAVGGAFGLLAAAFGIVIAIVMALIILTLRKILIIFLMVLAPLAIIAWILPNTKNMWKKWWESFSKLTLMFPLIVGFLAIGKVFAYISASGSKSMLTYFILLVAYFGPFFMIPKTFKMGGALLGGVAGGLSKMGSQFSKKGGDFIKNRGSAWAASKYKNPAGATGWRRFGRYIGNTAVRGGTGNLNPMRRGKASLSYKGMQFEKEQNDQAAALVTSSIAGLDYNAQGAALTRLAQSHDRRVRDSALRQIAASGRFGLLDDVEGGRPGTVMSLVNRDGEFGGKLAGKRRDLVVAPAGWHAHAQTMTAPDLVGQHDTFWGEFDEHGTFHSSAAATHLDHTTEALIRHNQQLYDSLGQLAKKHLGPPTY